MHRRRHSPFWISLGLSLVGGCLLLSSASQALKSAAPESRHRFERAIALQLQAQEPAIHRRSMDEQALKWHLANLQGRKAGVVVLGSSHSLPVSTSMLPAGPCLNLSASGAGLAEQLVSDQLLHEAGARPRVKLLVADPWLLDRGADFGKWRDRAGQAEAACQRLLGRSLEGAGYHLDEERPWQVRPWLDLGLLQGWLSDRTRLLLFKPSQLPASTTQHFLTIQPDGSFRDADEAVETSAEVSTAIALQQFASSPDRHRYGSYSNIDESLQTLLEAWIQVTRREGGEVWLLLSPYHPAIYRAILQKPDNRLLTLEARFRELGQKYACRVLGSYDPERAGVTAADFNDGDHLNAKGLAKVVGKASPLFPQPSSPAGQPTRP